MEKKRAHKKTSENIQKHASSSNEKIEKALIENLVSIEKVFTNLAVKFDHLSEKITKLLDIFEISAKALAEKGAETSNPVMNKDVLEKLDNLTEQNKTIARGLSLLHEKGQVQTPQGIPERTTYSEQPSTREIRRPFPRFQSK